MIPFVAVLMGVVVVLLSPIAIAFSSLPTPVLLVLPILFDLLFQSDHLLSLVD